MEEVGSQVSFELDTTMRGEHTIDFSGQNVIIHALRSSNKKATIIIKGGNIRFRKFPKVTGQLKILATGMVYLPKEKSSLNIQIEATGGKKIWKKDDTYFDLNALDHYTIRKKIEAKQHSLALVSLITDYDNPISLTLPKCNVVVAETAASHENATFTLNAENIWIMENQNVTRLLFSHQLVDGKQRSTTTKGSETGKF